MPSKKSKRPNIFTSLKRTVFDKFLKHKHQKNSITLEHNTIYVLPSSLGWYFIIVAILNFVMGINYQNNLILIMSYLMFVVIVLAVFMGYSNAKGLTVTFDKVLPSFSPQQPILKLNLHSNSICQSLSITYNNDLKASTHHDEISNKSISSSLPLPYETRGCYKLERIKIASNYPFGLVSVWSYLQVQTKTFVYPAHEYVLSDAHISSQDENTQNGMTKKSGTEEFDNLLIHQPEMGLSRISWKHFAKTKQLLVKDFVDFKATYALFDFNLMSGATEQRLSQLCYLVCEATEHNTPFMLKLPSKLISINTGQAHKQHCLECLSSFAGEKQ